MSCAPQSVSKLFRDGLWDQNVVFAQLLAMCPTMAVTTSGTNGLGMGLATTAVLVVSNMLISAIRDFVSDQVRIPVFVVVIATLVTLVDMALNAWLHELYKVLGLFIALIVVNCAILGRAEAFASKNGVLASAVDGLGEGGGDPAQVAARLGRPLDLVLRRLGMLRPGPWAQAGLNVCDGSGAALFRMPAPGFELPRLGEGCTLWPVFEALAQPQLPVARLIETTSGALFASWAVAERLLPMGFDGPALSRAQMLIRAARPRDMRPPLAVGPACRICPRAGCLARHEPSILGPA